MRNTNYAFSGAMYEVQKTLEAFFGRCEVTITEDKPRHAVEVEVKYKTHNEAKWYRQVITNEMLAYGQDIERYLARDIPHRIVMEELDAARATASRAMTHFR